MIRRPPRSTPTPSSAASDVYKRQVNEYLLKRDNIYHFDLYRIKSVGELNQIGFEDYIYSNNLCFIEWPKLALKYFFSCYLLINLKLIDKKTREVELIIKNQ